MAGVKKLRKMQFGPEATAGTPVAATTIWRGPVNGIEALDEIEVIQEDLASYGGANRTVKRSVGAQVVIPETPLTFEQFPWLLHAGVKAIQSGTQDGTGSGYIYTFDFPLSSAHTVKTLTVEAGNNQQVYEMEYSFCPEFAVRGEPDAPVMVSGILRGRQRSDSTFTAGLSVPSVDTALFNKSRLYLDPVSGSFGATQVSGGLLGFNIRVQTGWVPVVTGDGNLYFYTIEQIGWEIEVDVVFRHIADADTEDANWLDETARLLEIKLEGPNLQTPGTDYSKKTVRFQFPGKWTKFTAIEDRDGNDIITGTFRAAYDPTAGLGPRIIVVNEMSSYWS